MLWDQHWDLSRMPLLPCGTVQVWMHWYQLRDLPVVCCGGLQLCGADCLLHLCDRVLLGCWSWGLHLVYGRDLHRIPYQRLLPLLCRDVFWRLCQRLHRLRLGVVLWSVSHGLHRLHWRDLLRVTGHRVHRLFGWALLLFWRERLQRMHRRLLRGGDRLVCCLSQQHVLGQWRYPVHHLSNGGLQRGTRNELLIMPSQHPYQRADAWLPAQSRLCSRNLQCQVPALALHVLLHAHHCGGRDVHGVGVIVLLANQRGRLEGVFGCRFCKRGCRPVDSQYRFLLWQWGGRLHWYRLYCRGRGDNHGRMASAQLNCQAYTGIL